MGKRTATYGVPRMPREKCWHSHNSESSSTVFYLNIPHHSPDCSSFSLRIWFQQLPSLEPPLWLTKLSCSSSSHLKQQQHLLWCLGGSSFSCAPPNLGRHISMCPRDAPQFEKHLSPLVPLSSPRKLVSDTLDFFLLPSLLQRSTTHS